MGERLAITLDVRASYATFGTKRGFTQYHADRWMWKTVDDLARYRRVIEATRPQVLVETGTNKGGFAAWVADMFGIDVVTVDVAAAKSLAAWPQVTEIIGDSKALATAELVTQVVAGRRCMVSLDSDHHAPHVTCEIGLYGPLVAQGCYLVVEDGLADLVEGDEARRFGARIPETGGPLQAIERTLVDDPGWERDLDVEGMTPISHHPAGWWRRV